MSAGMTGNSPLSGECGGVGAVLELEDARLLSCDYDGLSLADAEYLKSVTLLPVDLRRELLERYVAEHGASALLEIFAQFVGLANSVVLNNEDMVHLLGWISGELHPDGGIPPNLPTIFGALQGVGVAALAGDAATCNGCAYRRGAIANQSPITTLDAVTCVDDRQRFMCHERELTDDGEPTLTCIGYAAAMALTHGPIKTRKIGPPRSTAAVSPLSQEPE